VGELTNQDRADFDFITDFLNRKPYTTPDGRVLTGEDALEFIEAFFPGEAEKFRSE
jgi:hypothetical protein